MNEQERKEELHKINLKYHNDMEIANEKRNQALKSTGISLLKIIFGIIKIPFKLLGFLIKIISR